MKRSRAAEEDLGGSDDDAAPHAEDGGEYSGLKHNKDDDEEALIEQSRQRRLRILAKHGGRGNDRTSETDAPPTALEGAGIEASPALAPRPAPPSDDSEDMFADTPEDRQLDATRQKPQSTKGLADSYDDAEGYYNFQVGEVLGDRYEVFATHGKGVFSSVLRARDVLQQHSNGDANDNAEDGSNDEIGDSTAAVAVKVIRANDTMFKAGQTEKVILNKLSNADPQNKMHCIRMLDSFEYRNHLCLVFEAMDMNLRDLTRKYGRGIGLHISAVRAYATQMFIALLHLENCGVLHADIKPDNILVDESRSTIKVCDFGSAMFSGDNAITPYLVSRFYRAPEVILGLPYNHPMDMWSVGCVIYELFTGHILFQGRTNNEMLKSMMDLKGPFPKKMLKKAEFAFKHFSGDSFVLEEEDLLTKQMVTRTIENIKVDANKSLARRCTSSDPAEKKRVAALVDLLERVFSLDPDKRITPAEALQHPFIVRETADRDRGSQHPRFGGPVPPAPRALIAQRDHR